MSRRWPTCCISCRWIEKFRRQIRSFRHSACDSSNDCDSSRDGDARPSAREARLSVGTTNTTRYAAQVPAFEIDQYEVTNRQYLEFMAAGGYDDARFLER